MLSFPRQSITASALQLYLVGTKCVSVHKQKAHGPIKIPNEEATGTKEITKLGVFSLQKTTKFLFKSKFLSGSL